MLLGEHKLDFIHGLLLGQLESLLIIIFYFVQRHKVVLLLLILLINALLHVILNLLHSGHIIHPDQLVELTFIEDRDELTKSLCKLF